MFKFLKRKTKLELTSPMKGEVIPIESVPDEVFANKYIGDGIAIIPTENNIYSPCDGKVVQIFPTKHAIGFETSMGIEVLLHIGIDTVALEGQGFKCFIEEGMYVKKGDLILEVDFEQIKEAGKSIISPLLVISMDDLEMAKPVLGSVDSNKEVILEVLKK